MEDENTVKTQHEKVDADNLSEKSEKSDTSAPEEILVKRPLKNRSSIKNDQPQFNERTKDGIRNQNDEIDGRYIYDESGRLYQPAPGSRGRRDIRDILSDYQGYHDESVMRLPMREYSASPVPDYPHHVCRNRHSWEDELDPVQQTIHIIDGHHISNMTTHMSLEAEDDLEGLLEEASRLRRLGHFTAAVTLFEQHLSHHLEDLYVRVQYAQCLFEGMQYKKLDHLAEKYPLETGDGALTLNWQLIFFSLRLDTGIDPEFSRNESKLRDSVVQFLRSLNSYQFGSTEVNQFLKSATSFSKLIKLQAKILCLSISNLSDDSLLKSSGLDLRRIYVHFLAEEMIWEVRDLLVDLRGVTSLESAFKILLDIDDTCPNVIETGVLILCKDWDIKSREEPLSFALLELFTTLALLCMKLPLQRKQADRCLEMASMHAEFLLAGEVTSVKTRPCLQWMMAKVLRAMYGSGQTSLAFLNYNDYPDKAIFTNVSKIFPYQRLPAYNTTSDTVPPWRPKGLTLPEELKRTARVVLKAAQSLGDNVLEIACWQQLIYQGEELPWTATTNIINLCRDMGNSGLLVSTALFQFLLVQNESDRSQLFEQLRGIGAEIDLRRLSIGSNYNWNLVLQALATSDSTKDWYAALAESCKVSNKL